MSTIVGSTTLTSIPYGASSARVASLNPTAANFEALYVAPSASATRPTADATLTMCPRPRSTIPGARALVPLMTPCRLTSTIARATACGSLSTEPSGMMPALLTRASIGPTSAVASRNAVHDSGSVTSRRAATTRSPNGCGHLGGQGDVEVADRDPGTLAGQPLDGGPADAAGTPGDEDAQGAEVVDGSAHAAQTGP